MSRVNIVQGNIFEAKSDYIAHQCNCITTKSAGFASEVFERFPASDDYKLRADGHRDKPGIISVRGRIINMFAQYYPGAPKYSNDSREKRLTWFRTCLKLVGKHVKEGSISFPYKIGCNMAGGNWPDYLKELENFAQGYPKINVTIYRSEE